MGLRAELAGLAGKAIAAKTLKEGTQRVTLTRLLEAHWMLKLRPYVINMAKSGETRISFVIDLNSLGVDSYKPTTEEFFDALPAELKEFNLRIDRGPPAVQTQTKFMIQTDFTDSAQEVATRIVDGFKANLRDTAAAKRAADGANVTYAKRVKKRPTMQDDPIEVKVEKD